jgi:hypothetical protein
MSDDYRSRLKPISAEKQQELLERVRASLDPDRMFEQIRAILQPPDLSKIIAEVSPAAGVLDIPPSLTPDHFTILQALAEVYPEAMVQPDLQERTRIPLRTIKRRLADLREWELVRKPPGTTRKGDALAPRGKAIVDSRKPVR